MQSTSKQPGVLAGKKVVLLGASAGIGLATAIAAATEGAQVIIVSGNQQRVNSALKQLPEGSEGFAVDLADEAAIKSFFENTGNFDHLVFTAGEALKLGAITSLSVNEAREFFNVRYWGAFAAVKYAASNINTNGSIVLTGGIAGARPNPGWSVGASVCAAMEGFCRATAVELAPIRVNIVVPGLVRTDLWSGFPEQEREGFYKQVADSLPVKRIGEPADIAKAYIYLMTQEFCTGQTIIADGGGVLV